MKNTLRIFIASFAISATYGAIAQPNVRAQQSTQERIYDGDMMSQNERQNYMTQTPGFVADLRAFSCDC